MSSREGKDSAASSDKTKLLKDPEDEEEAAIADIITCAICLYPIYVCVSAQPCLHSFCAACLSDWLESSNECPVCKGRIKSVARNHLTNSIIESWLASHGGRQETADELRLKESRDRIGLFKELSSDEDESSDDDMDTTDDEERFETIHTYPDETTHYVPPEVIIQPTCRQCPPANDGQFTCARNQAHITCTCCRQYMPDRRVELKGTRQQQACTICQRVFCHGYWTCRCQAGCLLPVNELPEPTSTRRIILDNAVETEYFIRWMQANEQSWSTLIALMCDYVREKRYLFRHAELDSPDRLVCIPCGHGEFRKFLVFLRKSLADDTAFDEAEARPKCYWGENCWTQITKESHARRYNHICEQRRFANS